MSDRGSAWLYKQIFNLLANWRTPEDGYDLASYAPECKRIASTIFAAMKDYDFNYEDDLNCDWALIRLGLLRWGIPTDPKRYRKGSYLELSDDPQEKHDQLRFGHKISPQMLYPGDLGYDEAEIVQEDGMLSSGERIPHWSGRIPLSVYRSRHET